MKVLILLGFLLINNISCKVNTIRYKDPDTVYICVSKYAKRYHYSQDCRGLKNCSHKIIKTTLTIAKSKGLTVCLFEN